MISDEMLKEAAARTCGSYISSLLSDYDPEYRCEFSAGFEKKIHRLKRRADHIVFYRTMQRIAMFILAILVAGSIWIAVDTNARAAFFGWVGDFIGQYFVFHHEAEPNGSVESADYRPAWIPEGYTEESVRVLHEKTVVRYTNDRGKLLRFSYMNTSDEMDWFFDTSQGSTRSCYVGKYSATLFISSSDDVASALTWVNSNDTAFHVTGFVSEDELIKMAESVSVIKK